MKNLLSIVFLCCTYVSSVMRSSWHFSTSGFNIRFPRTPQKIKKEVNNTFSSDYFHDFTCCWEDSFGVKSISKFSWGLEAYIKKCLWVLLTHVYWFRATGGYICGCGRPSNLVHYVNLWVLCNIDCMWIVFKLTPNTGILGAHKACIVHVTYIRAVE